MFDEDDFRSPFEDLNFHFKGFGFGLRGFSFENAEEIFRTAFGDDDLRNFGFRFMDQLFQGLDDDDGNVFFRDPFFKGKKSNQKAIAYNDNRSQHKSLGRDLHQGQLIPKSLFDEQRSRHEQDFFGFGQAQKMMQKMENMMNHQIKQMNQMFE